MAARGRGPSAAPFRYALSQLLFWEGRLDEMRRLAQEAWEGSLDRPGDLHDLWRIDHAPPTFDSIRAAVEAAAAMPRTTTASGWPAPTWRSTRAGSTRRRDGSTPAAAPAR